MAADPAGGRRRGAGWIARLSDGSSRFFAARGLYLGRRSTRFHVALYRLSRGRLGGRVPGWPQARIALVDHTGARSGRRRTAPLMYVAEDDTVAVVASKAGEPRHPAWFHNLLAHPETTVQIGAERRPVRARVAAPGERERLWPRFVAAFPNYGFYAERAAPREIPLVLLEPRARP
ncbi:MAG TPA: nitroreductase/quinone reductase family protein [Solirubrobacterales bacterium]|nr:nitroreductase/quinone reductase family protein [Solirubrobacterales bacterium]